MGASNVSDVAVSCVSGLSISTAGFGNLQVGHDLSGVQLSAAGGSGSYTWSAADATQPLPAGLSLSASGLLTGTPTTAGAYTSSVTVTDSGGTSQQMLMTTKAANAVSQVFSGTVAAAVATPTATPVPSLGAWAVVLLNLMAAALGALGLRWRRRSAGLTDSTPKHH
ncbi:Ig domain-containing protein [Comamonas odontotermitis]|uniref:Ig domain-containing protein n=1 Tax=Comamonas odontotermitis TaxID=379895 RepID=UPI003751D45E